MEPEGPGHPGFKALEQQLRVKRRKQALLIIIIYRKGRNQKLKKQSQERDREKRERKNVISHLQLRINQFLVNKKNINPVIFKKKSCETKKTPNSYYHRLRYSRPV